MSCIVLLRWLQSANSSLNQRRCGVNSSLNQCRCGVNSSPNQCRCRVHSLLNQCRCGVHSLLNQCRCGVHSSPNHCRCGVHITPLATLPRNGHLIYAAAFPDDTFHENAVPTAPCIQQQINAHIRSSQQWWHDVTSLKRPQATYELQYIYIYMIICLYIPVLQKWSIMCYWAHGEYSHTCAVDLQ